jgi:hypothetical protein
MIEYASVIRGTDEKMADELSIWAEREWRRDADMRVGFVDEKL